LRHRSSLSNTVIVVGEICLILRTKMSIMVALDPDPVGTSRPLDAKAAGRVMVEILALDLSTEVETITMLSSTIFRIS
jgi:hypothetical protein